MLSSYRSGGGSLKLIGSDSGDGGAPATLVGDPVERVIGSILAIRAQTTSGTNKITVKSCHH